MFGFLADPDLDLLRNSVADVLDVFRGAVTSSTFPID